MRRLLLFSTLLLALATAPPVLADPSAGDSQGSDSHASGDHGDSHGPPLGAKLVNTLIFFGVLGWFAGPWIAAQFRTRKAEIARELGAAQAAREAAEAKLAEIEARLSEVDAEVKGILEKAGAQAEAEKERIVAGAESEAERILEQAETQIGELESRASQRLRSQAADLAVDLARGLVTKELADADRARIFDDYLDGLEKAAG